MPTSDEDLQKKTDEIQKLREQVANQEATREERERDLANQITMKQLEAEEASLRARLTVAQEAGKVSSVKAGAEAPLAAVTDQLKVAVAQQEASKKAASANDADGASGNGSDGTES